MAISSGDLLQVVMEYAFPGAGTALNIFYWVYAGVDKDEGDLLTDLQDWAFSQWGALWTTIASNEATIDKILVNEVSPTGLLIRQIGTAEVDAVGAIPGDVLPAANSAYIQGYTAVPRVFGKKYVPGIEKSQVDNGSFIAGALINIAALATQYLDRYDMPSGGTLFPGVLSSKTGGFEAFIGTVFLESLVAYQRRRKQGVGS